MAFLINPVNTHVPIILRINDMKIAKRGVQNSQKGIYICAGYRFSDHTYYSKNIATVAEVPAEQWCHCPEYS